VTIIGITRAGGLERQVQEVVLQRRLAEAAQ